MRVNRHGMTLIEHLVLITIILILIALILPATRPARYSFRGENREPNAIYEIPQESLRFLDKETGISIVRPDHWSPHDNEVRSLEISGGFDKISVRAVSPPTAQERSLCQFVRHGGWPAYELMVIFSHETLDGLGYSRYARLVKTDVGWFKIEYECRSSVSSTLADGPCRFLDTVRFPDKPVAEELVFDVDLPVPPAQ